MTMLGREEKYRKDTRRESSVAACKLYVIRSPGRRQEHFDYIFCAPMMGQKKQATFHIEGGLFIALLGC